MMSEIIKQITIYHNLYVINLLISLSMTVITTILFVRWKMYYVLKWFGGKKKKERKNTNDKTTVTVKLKKNGSYDTHKIDFNQQLD